MSTGTTHHEGILAIFKNISSTEKTKNIHYYQISGRKGYKCAEKKLYQISVKVIQSHQYNKLFDLCLVKQYI